MARTAPVPNIPPIPGMCPSIAVMGGGGGGGGGSGDGAGDGDGNGPADGNGSGDGAGGDGSNAGACGNGQGCGCPNCQAGTAAGDPIDVVTGRVFTNPVTDLGLRGPLPYAFTRAYSISRARRDGPLGYGWSHTLGWEIELRRDRTIVWRNDGTRAIFPLIETAGESVLGLDGWVLRKEVWGYLLDCGDHLWRAFAPDPNRPETQRLSAIQDRNGNRLSLTYDDGKLVEIIDSAGRVIRATSTPDGRLHTLDVKNEAEQGRWQRFASYEYDDRGNLVTTIDADGNPRRYQYDDAHRLLSHSDGTGLTFFFRYDSQGRAVESWGEYPGRPDPSLADSLPPLLADGVTKALGIMHVKLTFGPNGYSEVADSNEVARFFGNRFDKLDKTIRNGAVTSRKYDDRGFVSERSDALGAVTRWQRDVRGRKLSMTNALGATTRWRRNETGDIVAIENASGDVVSMTRDSRGNIVTLVNQVGGVTSFRYDARGLMESIVEPNGAGTRLKYDERGNKIEVIEPNGAVWKASHDFYGNRTSLTNPLGEVMRYEHSLGGLLVRYVAPDGTATSYSYDAAGHLTRATDSDGTSVGLEWGGYNARHQVNKPDGSSIRYRFDRDGRLREIHDELGNVHTREYQTGGFLSSEKTFDGRVLRYKHDACGQLAEVVNGAHEKTKFEYDALGQLIERSYADGLSETFAYNATGGLIVAKSGGTRTEFERDPRGLCVGETQIVDGVAHTIRRSFDLAGLPMGRSTSLQHSLDIQRDSAGTRARDLIDGSLEIDYTRDLLGRITHQSLGAGGLMEDVFDNRSRLTERRVRAAGASAIAVGDGEPAWVGARRSTAGIDKVYRYSGQGDLLDVWTLADGNVTYEYDTVGQLLERRPERGDGESFRFDPGGNMHEAGPNAVPRKYAKQRLVERGGVEYTWDGDGRLTQKVRRSPDGSSQRWVYNWSSKGTLKSVLRPDKTRVEFVYDAFFRRLAKRVVPARKQDRAGAVSTRFVWDAASLVHEIRSTKDIVSERTYCFDGAVPKAQRDVMVHKGVREEGPWLHYVNDLAGTPEELVDARGVVVARLKRSTWGKGAPDSASPATTNIRFQGQYEDEETGLSYNRHRYYDAETGRYISADPLGVAGGLNPFAYVPNPNGYVDPLGLTISAVTEDLAASMASDPVNRRPIQTEHQAHHIVPREHERGAADSARTLLEDNNIGLDEAENGARLMGRTKANVDAGGHERGCAGYHGTRSDGTGSVHSTSAYDTVNRRLQRAATDSGHPDGHPAREAAIRSELRVIGGEMEGGTWMTDEDRANAAR